MTEGAGRPSVQLIVVVIPARDEMRRIGPCLDALGVAIGELRIEGGAPAVRTVVVLDRCTDQTAEVVACYPWAQVVVSTEGRVGAARAIGVRAVLPTGPGVVAERIWVATTDADSRVPANWLTHQMHLAAQGVDLFRGLVEPDRDECGSAAYEAWSMTYERADGHAHVHGANLGIRADAYVQCGGFDELAAMDEDVLLARGAQQRQLRVVASAQASVATSGRLRGRVTGPGFADFLSRLDRELSTGRS